ncbi:MAG TPA: cytochrome b/b6 domain-containing protein [Hyphomicrobiaceae bacterium]|jgi:cytochrome b561|nr:cytochrome b/b6 domain-containing protein [Hyphomicrobiaceae bacterium]
MTEPAQNETYSLTARRFHWWMVAFLAVQIPIGLVMNYRGNVLDIWDATTNALYSGHKLLGFVLLWIVVARLSYRLWHGVPDHEPTIEPWQRTVSRSNHWGLYVLLLVLPLLGWIGVSLYPALEVFGPFSLPALAAPNKAAAEWVLAVHKALAFLLIALIGLHVSAALYHYFVRRDGVLRRMLVRAGKLVPRPS